MASFGAVPPAILSADRGRFVVGSVSTCMALATLAVLGRMLSRRLISRIFTCSDYLMVVAYFGSAAVSATVLAGMSKLKSPKF